MQELVMQDQKPDLRKFLIIGPEGSGKTAFIRTMPKPIYLFSFDKGYGTLAGEVGIKVGVFLESNRPSPKAYQEFLMKFNALQAGEMFEWPDGKKERYKTLAFDPLTFFSMALFDFVQFVNSNVDKKAGFAEYQVIKSRSEDLLNKAIGIAEYVVCTGLIESKQDTATGEMFFVPNMIGKIGDEIGAWFDVVFYMQVDKLPSGDRVFKMMTVGGMRHKAKIRIPVDISKKVPAILENPSFERLKELVDKEWDAYVRTRNFGNKPV